MDTAMPAQQRGLSFGEVLVGAVLLVAVGIFGLKLIPAYMQDAQIKNVFNAITHDPEMQKASPREIRNSFERRASIEGVKSIKADDIEISSDNGKLFLSISYSVKVPIAGNASLLLEFNPTSAQ